MRDFDVDLERRDRIAAIHPYVDVLALHRDVLGDRGQDLLPKKGQQVALAARRPFVRQEYLQPLPRDRGRAPPPEKVEHVHAALRPNSLSKKRLRSAGMIIGTSSPRSRRAASA